MHVALFIILPYPSHYHASYGLAREYQRRGYRIVFTGRTQHRDLVEEQGHEFRCLTYTIGYQIGTLKGFATSLLISLLNRKDVPKRYREWYGSLMEVRQLCAQYRPERIFIDAHLGHYYLYLFDHRATITMISTKLLTRKSPGLPPLNSFHVPQDTVWSRAFSEWLWLKYVSREMLQDFVRRAAFLGYDERYFQRRLCRQLGLHWNQVFNRQNAFFLGLKSVPTIVLGDERLEFARKKRFSEVTYQHWPIQRNEDAYWSDQYRLVREEIEVLKSQADYQVVYCSFGTLSGLNRKKVLDFLPKLIAAVRKESVILVIATGGLKLDHEISSERIFLLPQVPQLDMIRLSDLMITHGGHNSIKECLQAEVPMLVYSLNLKVDQPGNAVRVYQAGYGMFGKMGKDSSTEIRRKIKYCLRMKENRRLTTKNAI